MKYLAILFLFCLSLGVEANQLVALDQGGIAFDVSQTEDQSALNSASPGADRDISYAAASDMISTVAYALSQSLDSSRPSSIVAIFWLIGSVLFGLGLLVTGRSRL